MKTIKEWFESIEDETIREKALANLINDMSEIPEKSLSEALVGSFSWTKSPEGFNYWYSVYNEAYNNNL